LKDVLEAGRKNAGIGGFLHYSTDVMYDAINQQWTFKTAPITQDASYRVALSDFLLTGGEANLGFLNKDNSQILKVYPVATSVKDSRSDIRLAIIAYMEKLKL